MLEREMHFTRAAKCTNWSLWKLFCNR